MPQKAVKRLQLKFGTITLIDVARETVVSLATILRVINNQAHVRPQKRERVLKAMARLNYTSNLPARKLRPEHSHMIGPLVRDVGTGYAGEIARGIDLQPAGSHHDMMLHSIHRRKTQEPVYVTLPSRGIVDSLLLILPRNPQACLQVLPLKHVPHVLIDRQGIDNRNPAVDATNWQGVFEAKSFIELSHCNNSIIGFDVVPQAIQVHPPFTTVRQPLELIGRAATKFLVEIIKS